MPLSFSGAKFVRDRLTRWCPSGKELEATSRRGRAATRSLFRHLFGSGTCKITVPEPLGTSSCSLHCSVLFLSPTLMCYLPPLCRGPYLQWWGPGGVADKVSSAQHVPNKTWDNSCSEHGLE